MGTTSPPTVDTRPTRLHITIPTHLRPRDGLDTDTVTLTGDAAVLDTSALSDGVGTLGEASHDGVDGLTGAVTVTNIK